MTKTQLIDALRPFAEIGAYLFARQDVPDETPLVEVRGLHNRSIGSLTRGAFKAATNALRALEGSPPEPLHAAGEIARLTELLRICEAKAIGAPEPEAPPTPQLCPHGMPLAENICGPCSEGRPNAPPPVLTTIPAAWIRGHVTHTESGKEYDEEVVLGRDPPKGDGWTPLYPAPPPAQGMDTPWPLHDVLAKLIEAAEHLLKDHNCDTHGHESYRTAAEAGKKLLQQPQPASEAPDLDPIHVVPGDPTSPVIGHRLKACQASCSVEGPCTLPAGHKGRHLWRGLRSGERR